MPLLTQLLKVIASTESQKTQMGITLNTEKGILHCKHKQNWVVEEILIQKTHYQLLDAGALLQG